MASAIGTGAYTDSAVRLSLAINRNLMDSSRNLHCKQGERKILEKSTPRTEINGNGAPSYLHADERKPVYCQSECTAAGCFSILWPLRQNGRQNNHHFGNEGPHSAPPSSHRHAFSDARESRRGSHSELALSRKCGKKAFDTCVVLRIHALCDLP